MGYTVQPDGTWMYHGFAHKCETCGENYLPAVALRLRSPNEKRFCTDVCAEKAQLRPCRSPYCECDFGKCTHPGCYDARHEPWTAPASFDSTRCPSAEWNGA